jgi:SNF2 family DNA or RNA helicase
VFGIFRVIDLGKTFGINKFIYQSKYLIDKNARNPHVNFPNWIDNPATYEELTSKIYSKSLRKLKSECLDLPDLIKLVRLADWGSVQKKTYDNLKKEFLAFIDTQKANGEPESVTASLAIVKALRMLQVASGFVMLDSGEIHEFETPKLDLVEELLEEIVIENKQKCILWAAYKHNYKMLAKVCDKLKLKYVFITGEQSTNEKRESELAFQKGDAQVMIANMASGGVGVNLTAASHSIVYSRSFSLAHSLQSEARNHRSGSEIHEKIVKIDLAIKGSLDEMVMLALNNKTQISREILDLIK